MVADLIDQPKRRWNAHLIREWFSQEDANNILHIHIPLEDVEDEWQWIHTVDGQYTVKSGYALLVRDAPGATHHYLSDKKFWKFLWALNMAPKWKFFVWRVIHEALGTMVNLQRRRIPGNTFCLLLMSTGRRNHNICTSGLYGGTTLLAM